MCLLEIGSVSTPVHHFYSRRSFCVLVYCVTLYHYRNTSSSFLLRYLPLFMSSRQVWLWGYGGSRVKQLVNFSRHTSLWLVRRNRVIPPLSLNIGTRGQAHAEADLPSLLPWKGPSVPVNTLSGPRAGLNALKKRQLFCLCRKSNHASASPYPSHYLNRLWFI
jgi:hypothetical protein